MIVRPQGFTSEIIQVRREFTAAEINDLMATQREIYPNTGVNTYIALIAADLVLTAGDNPFTAASALVVLYDGSAIPLLQWPATSIEGASDLITTGIFQGTPITDFENKSLQLSTLGAIAGGDGSVAMDLTLQIRKIR